MRPFLAGCLAFAVFGGVHTFLMTSNARIHRQVAQAGSYSQRPAPHHYSLDVTISFGAEADVFAADAPVALRLHLGQTTVLEHGELIEAGTVLTLERIEGVVVGMNEFYVQAFPNDDYLEQWAALRLRVLRGDTVVAEQTLWAPPGDPVAGTLRLYVPAVSAGPDHGH
jgi:hypothetical protein